MSYEKSDASATLNLRHKLWRFKQVLLAIFWLVGHYHPLQRLLKYQHGFEQLRPYKFFSWALGNRYFLALDAVSQQKVFIKVAPKQLVVRETSALQRLEQGTACLDSWPRLMSHYVDKSKAAFVVLQFVAAESLETCLTRSLEPEFRAALLHQLSAILTCLQTSQLLHRDIRPANLLVKLDQLGLPRLCLIDFAFALLMDEDLPLQTQRDGAKNLKTLGDGLNPAPFVWDDAYSLCQIALLIDKDCPSQHPQIWQQLRSQVGHYVYRHGS
jgi:serine/threonine protein kinase